MLKVRGILFLLAFGLFMVSCFADSTINVTVTDTSSKYLFRTEAAPAVLKIATSIVDNPITKMNIELYNYKGNFTADIFDKICIYEDSLVSGLVGYYDSTDILREVKTAFAPSGTITVSLNFSVSSMNMLTTGTHTFFVVYDVLDSASIGTVVGAQITSIQIPTSSIVLTASVVGTLPGPVAPAIMTIINDYTLTLNNISSPLNHSVYQSSIKVPVLKFDLTKIDEALGSEISLKFRNEGSCGFNSYSEGITKAWLYKDNLTNGTTGKFDSQDMLISTSQTYSNEGKDVLFTDVALNLNQPTTFFLLYDVGQSATGTFNARIANIETSGLLFMSSDFPHDFVMSQNIQANPLVINSISANVSIINEQLTQNIIITISITNKASYPIDLGIVAPTFFQDSINGKDNSAEYLIENIENFPLTINPGSMDISARILTKNIITEGTVFLDALVNFVSADVTTQLNRYLVDVSQYNSAVSGSAHSWYVVSGRTVRNWDFPVFVLTANLVYGLNTIKYESGDPVESGAKLQLYFNQNVIDSSTFRVSFSGNSCQQVAGSPINVYEYNYNSASGVYTTYVPTESGKLTISLQDQKGSALSDVDLDFVILDKLVLDSFLLYPNPFVPSGLDTLTFAFNTNRQPSYLDLYVLDAGGKIVWQSKSNYFALPGYNEYKWDGKLDSGRYLPSGIYSIRAILADLKGNRVSARSKLAVR